MQVEVKDSPSEKNWKLYDTLTVENLDKYTPVPQPLSCDKYGGAPGQSGNATGFFRVEKIGPRWWLIDPDGNRFIHIAIAGVYRGHTELSRRAVVEQFGNNGKWAQFCAELLARYGFNGVGGWSDASHLTNTSCPPTYTLSWNFMGEFARGKRLSWQVSGHLGYPNEVWPVFHPDFEDFCDAYASRLSATKNDPFCIGHFSDNELQTPVDMLDRTLQLDLEKYPEMKYNVEEAWRWFTNRKAARAIIEYINDEDRQEFLGWMYERYFWLTTSAIRRHDPNHLCLGSRFHGVAKNIPAVFRAAGRFLDVVSVNYYKAWTPKPWLMDMWVEESGKPFMITEWYAKGEDSGLPNTAGAGWLVKTQVDRGRFYHNFAIGLMKHRGCVGWHWFKFVDNNPADVATDPSNRDSNKGVLTSDYRPYTELLAGMKSLNDNVYPLIDWLDSRSDQ